MSDVHLKLSDGVHEVSVELNGSDDDPLARAEGLVLRLLAAVRSSSSEPRRAGFNSWALSSDTERSPEED